MVAQREPQPLPEAKADELRGLALAIREGLLVIVRYIEWRYGKERAPRPMIDDKRERL
jgi:hypothetical protein